MFDFFKTKSKIKVNFKDFFAQDMHSHILPGLDDGSPDVDTSIELINGMRQCGITHFMGTPHIMSDIHKNNRTTITNAYLKLQETLVIQNINVEVHYAAEYMMDDGFIQHIEADNLLTVFDNYVLIETPFYTEPMEIDNLLFELESKGYKGILAHPERYHYVDDHLKVFEKYLNRDFPLQLNILSLSGYYGSREKEIAEKLLEADLYSFIGTDLHHERHLKRLDSMVLNKKTIRLLEQTNWMNNLVYK
ncbi:MAG TPA: hypothetical protein PKX92_06325 [Edaphocola sp.]|nr:hypothetical protein [Edaphocola sp.]